MCGIAGFLGKGTRGELEAMIDAIKHRGPDDRGIVLDRNVGLAHARLSIIDTSPTGHQPMSLSDASVTIVLNGEIYNYRELREELMRDGCTFQGASDTEVILWLYKRKGILCFKELIGMFALALHDAKKETLILARDRMGEKPLYWTKRGGTILFASELRGLLATHRVDRNINPDALKQYLFSDYVPTPHSILEHVFKLEPATLLICTGNSVEKKKYWAPPRHTASLSLTDASAQLEELLQKSVAREVLSADVPLGVFLSGGLDSSTIAYFAQKASTRPIDTFSIAFDDSSFDESRYARDVAAHIGSNHHEERLTANAALDLVQQIPDVFSEPVADASVLPTMLLSRFARKSVTVALGGDGSDELFAGYPTFQADAFARAYTHMPSAFQRMLKSVANMLPVSHEDFSFSYKLQKLFSSHARDPVERHLEWLGSFPPRALLKLAGPKLHDTHGTGIFALAHHYADEIGEGDAGNQLLYMYARTYLMDQVLVKVDRASMHYALETRAPFLDHTIVDFVFSLPYSFKYRNGTTKYILKHLMHGKLPPNIVRRKKKGFGVPLAGWLTKELRPLCEELLSPSSLGAHQLFNQEYVHRLKNEHMEGVRDNRKELWNLMVFQLWFDRWIR
ncbi:MAG: asparagine synthase (glutamine-hydrolyzing) [bacterium]|nr:asparagine synthase (glutamine-hydrolyzing) [bacterium]